MNPVIIELDGRAPVIATSAFVAPTATLIGSVILAEGASIWYGCVLRADLDSIDIGQDSNVQDNAVFHTDAGLPLRLGARVTVGHTAIVHGAVVGDDVLIGMGAILLNGSIIGAGSVIAAGALVAEGTEIPPHSLVIGVPGKVRREVSDAERARAAAGVLNYRELARRHAFGRAPKRPAGE